MDSVSLAGNCPAGVLTGHSGKREAGREEGGRQRRRRDVGNVKGRTGEVLKREGRCVQCSSMKLSPKTRVSA